MNEKFIGATMATLLLAGAYGITEAAVVVYDNTDGEFKWTSGIHYTDHSEKDGTFLDITQPPSQTGVRRAGTVGKWWRPNNSSSNPATRHFMGEAGVEIAETDDAVWLWWNDMWLNPVVTREYAPGDFVASDAAWNSHAWYFYHLPFSGSFSEGTPAISTLAYVGVRTKIADQWHYGWILFADYMTPLKWAYETEPNVPIAVPVPAPWATSILMLSGTYSTIRRSRR